MKIEVTVSSVIIDNDYIVNKGEYKVNPCEFTFSSEYDGLVKKAIFVVGNNQVERAIINDKCDIPYDVLESDVFELCVYGYEVNDNELILRYSPTYAKVFLRDGSYRGVTGSGEIITPTQFEQYEQALNDGLREVENINIEAEKIGSVANINITNKDGVTSNIEIYDGQNGQDGQDGFSPTAIVEQTITGAKITIIDKNGTTSANVLNGEKGEKGEDGLDGNTPIRGIDYWTNADKEEIVGDVITDITPTLNEKADKSEIPDELRDLTDDSTHRLVTDTEKTTWNAKGTYSKPSGGIPKTDLDSSVQASLDKADTALQTHQDISGKQDVLVAGANISIAADGKTISATDTTYNDATTSTAGLMSATDKTKLNGIASGAEVNVQSNWNETNTSSDSYIQNKPTIPTVNNSTITIQMNGSTVDSFTTNASSAKTIDLGTVITSHQDISGKLDTSKVKNAASTTAGDVYDVRYINTMLGDIETILTTLTTGSGV